MKKDDSALIPVERIREAIILLRGQKVMLDRDLAALYGVETKVLKRAVKRNADRFPEDFMFVLSAEEFTTLRSQFVTSRRAGHAANVLRCQIGTSKNETRGGTQYAPMAFTEQGVAMLSSVLNSEQAIRVNIAIMRAFVQLRQLLATHEDLARKLADLEKKYDAQFRAVFDAIRQLMTPPEPPPKKIGFSVRESSTRYRTGRKRASQRIKGEH